MTQPEQNLQSLHEPEVIRARLKQAASHSYLGDLVFGAIDGTVTTFAVVSGVAGAGLSNGIALVLGCANLFADGFSMAAGNYLSTKAEIELVDRIRRSEEMHIEAVPEGEREEIRQIYAAKGLTGESLEIVVSAITADKKQWVQTMLTEEHGLRSDFPSPLKAGTATFAAFLLAGFVPLIPFLLPGIHWSPYLWSTVLTAITFFLIGVTKGRVVQKNPLGSGLETLLIGGGAACLAYLVGQWLRGFSA